MKARAVIRVTGAGARETLAKLCPVDLAPGTFTPGMVRRTRLGQIPAAFWLDGRGAFHLICFRSVADYAFGALCELCEDGYYLEGDSMRCELCEDLYGLHQRPDLYS